MEPVDLRDPPLCPCIGPCVMPTEHRQLTLNPDAFAMVMAPLVGETITVDMGRVRFDVLHGYGFPVRPFRSLLNMPGAE